MKIVGLVFCSACVALAVVSITGLPNTQAQPVVIVENNQTAPAGNAEVVQIVPSTPNAAPVNATPTGMQMVMVDKAKLDAKGVAAFESYLRTASLPQSPVINENIGGSARCQYYGRPQIWCLLLEGSTAQNVYNELKGQQTFASAVEMKSVRRLKEPSDKHPKG